QIGSTGISGVGAISAVNMGGSWPQVMAVKNGVLHQIYGDTSGWHDGSLAISANQPAAVNMGAAWPQVMVLK
ncbi:hypothetical protein, partial [Catelliglobosispora koreensis]|uniref:hypothetical protein n=1 Tax=Catelliglobosispora koreensis TaxID=129052 RepID=UPI000476D635